MVELIPFTCVTTGRVVPLLEHDNGIAPLSSRVAISCQNFLVSCMVQGVGYDPTSLRSKRSVLASRQNPE